MKKSIIRMAVSCLIAVALSVVSCSPAPTEEEEATPPAEEQEVMTEEEEAAPPEEEVVTEEEEAPPEEEAVTEEDEVTPPVEGKEVEEPTSERNYRQDMRDFVQAISAHAREVKSNFVIIPQNGHELLTENGEETGAPALAYLEAIDGVGREDLFYGYNDDDVATPVSERDYMISFMDDSYYQNAARGYISFATDHRELDNIPEYPPNPFNMNPANVMSLVEAKNFLYLINPGSYSNKTGFLNALGNTDYDIVIIDAFYEGDILTAEDITSLKTKINGGNRLIIAYMSIGEAEDYRYYWQKEWRSSPPSWLAGENPNWLGNYKVRYWDPAWQEIIYRNDNSYLRKILDAGFDGVYLDIIDAFEYFENQ